MSGSVAQLLSAAALEPYGWIQALEAIAAATRSDRAQLIGFGRGYSIDFNWASGDDNGIIEAFAAVPPHLNFRVMAKERFGNEAIVYERHYEAVSGELESDTYLEMCRIWGIPFGCQTNLRDDVDGLIGLSLLHSERTGRTSVEQRTEFDRIRREAAHAVSLQIAIERQGFHLIAGTFEAMSSACFVLDRNLRVGAMTPLAEAALSDGVLRRDDGRLASPLDRSGALPAIHKALSEVSARRVILPDPAGPAISLHYHRLPHKPWGFGFDPYAVAVLTRTSAPAALDGATLRSAFGLTAAEAEIALLLRAGLDRTAMRAARGITHETLRSHLGAIFAKLGVRREIDAVRLLERLH